MKTVTFLKVSGGVFLAAAIFAGCSTPMIDVTMDTAGEIKLTGVSKIALANFNSMPDDAFAGVKAADPETCALVKRAVASAFYTSPMYQIADLDIEKDIHEADSTKLVKKRFDAFVYGRLWWQIAPAASGLYPEKLTLKTWKNVPYKQKDPITKKDVPMVAKVTTETRDVIQMMDYNVQHAALMLTLSIYRVDHNGTVEKIVDTYQVTSEGFVLKNGEIKVDTKSVGFNDKTAAERLQETKKEESAFAAIGDGLKAAVKKDEPKKDPRRDANGKLILTQKTVAMPTELQAKLMLATSVSQKLGAKLAPSKMTFQVPADLGDDRLVNLLKNGAFKSARAYSLYMLRNKLGRQICDKVSEYVPELAEDCSYSVPDSKKQLAEYDEELVEAIRNGGLYFYTLGTSHGSAEQLAIKAKVFDEMFKYLKSEGVDIYFYALGICQETSRELDAAEESYRFAFNVNPNQNAALGIARARLALGNSERLSETRKAKKAAAKKTVID